MAMTAIIRGHRGKTTWGRVFGLMLVLLCVMVDPARGQTYVVDRIFAPGEVVDGVELTEVHSPLMNDRGDVVFSGVGLIPDIVTDPPDLEFYLGEFLNGERIITPGDIVDGITISSVQGKSLNNHGDLAFAAAGFETDPIIREFFAGWFVNDQRVIAPEEVGAENLFPFGRFPILLSDSGEIAHEVFDGVDRAIFINDRRVVTQGDVVDGVKLVDVDLGGWTNAGEFIYEGWEGDSAPERLNGLFVEDQRILGLGDTVDGFELTFIGPYSSVASNGDIAFTAAGVPTSNPGGSDEFAGLFINDQRVLVPGNEIVDFESDFISEILINSRGDRVFIAVTFDEDTFDFSFTALYYNDQLLFEAGDVVDGVRIDAIDSLDLNNNGDLIFIAETFASDSIMGEEFAGLFRVRLVPEPGTAVVSALGFAVLAASRVRRQKHYAVVG